MRKSFLLLLTIALPLTILLSGCGGKEADKEVADSSIDTPIQIQPIDPPVSSKSEEAQDPEASPPKESLAQTEVTGTPEASAPVNNPPSASIPEEHPDVDIDLTGFNANMLYAEVFNMGMNPDDYKGKIIRITGDFACFPKDLDNNGNPISDEEIFVCLISDAMACCQSGVEFIPEKDSPFWQERPTEGSEITITGLCDIFLDESGWFTTIQLDNAKID